MCHGSGRSRDHCFAVFLNILESSNQTKLFFIIIVVIIMWPSEKLHQKKNSDITVIRASDSFKWVMFMQNFELGVTVFNQ